MSMGLALELDDINPDPITAVGGAEAATLESLLSGHGMPEMAASVMGNYCCSCSLPCCCC